MQTKPAKFQFLIIAAFIVSAIISGACSSKTGESTVKAAEAVEQKFGSTDLRRLALLWADRDIKLVEALIIAAREHAARKDIYTADIYAWCLYKNGKLKEAKKIINEALKLKTNDARIIYHAGVIERGLGNKKEAVKLLRLAIETNPAFDVLQAEKAREALRELK